MSSIHAVFIAWELPITAAMATTVRTRMPNHIHWTLRALRRASCCSCSSSVCPTKRPERPEALTSAPSG